MRPFFIWLSVGASLSLGVPTARAQEPVESAPLRIGTFDSRAVAIAYYNSPAFQGIASAARAELQTARDAGDSTKVRQLETYMPAMQQVMHLQGFGSGSVGEIMAGVADQLPTIAQEAGVALVVSKWEVAYRDAAVDVVDLTPQIVALFGPSEQAAGWIADLAGKEPIPTEDLLKAGEEH